MGRSDLGRDDVHRYHVQRRHHQAHGHGRRTAFLIILRPLSIVVAILAVMGAADARTDAFAVGVLRRDGLLIPIGVFDGKRWSVNWPAPTASSLEVPVSVSNVPKRWWGPTGPLQEWQAWAGGQPLAVRVQQPDWVDAHCLRQVVLRTDYHSPQPSPPPTERPYPKDGLAVAPPKEVRRIEIVPKDGVEASELLGVVSAGFNRAERETAERYRHPITEKTREDIQPEIEAVYAFGAAPRAYYVEAGREYRTGRLPDVNCVMAFGTGWFLRDSAQVLRKADMAVDVLGCDRAGAMYMLPLGVIRVADRTFWIAQYSGWIRERFVVIEIKQGRVEAVVNAFGGGC